MFSGDVLNVGWLVKKYLKNKVKNPSKIELYV
jgi:hypothetical protein